MISNLLHLCRCDEGQFEIEISEVQLDQMIDKNCARLAFESGRKNISIELPKQRLPILLADVNWFGLLLFNLISNAIAHSPPNARVKIVVFTNSDRCAIEIKNPMIDYLTDSDISHIFDRFWRKDSARTTGEHAGIGLSLVKSYSSCLNMGVDASVSNDNMFNIRLSNIKIVY